jgi:hypothetical protein
MAKVVLIMDAFVDKEWLRGRPLIYPTSWNTGLYVLAAVVLTISSDCSRSCGDNTSVSTRQPAKY